MRTFFGLALACWLCLTIPGCGRGPGELAPAATSPAAIDLSDPEAIRSALYDQYRSWRAVPYRSGGLGRSGVDCSGFVFLTYRHLFGIRLPRTTADQARYGRELSGSKLQPGDLVLFKTGWLSRHIGIYLEKDRFLHASTRQGVMLSGLDEAYWRDRFWQARRAIH